MDKKARTAFLRSDTWGDFRKKLLEERGAICCLCGKKYYGVQKKNLHVHHLSPRIYDDLDPSKFALLCKPCHRYWHRILVRSSSKCLIRNKGLWELMLFAITPKSIDSGTALDQFS